MNSKRALQVLVVTSLLFAPACSLTFDATSLGVKASVSEPAGSQVTGESFDVTTKAFFFFWGAVGGGRPSLQEALSSQLVDGSEVANLEIKVRSRFVDLLVTGLTGGLIVPRSVTFRGVVVQNPGN